ncbi:secreted RxLR effector peptide protein, putative [Phytophthora infestans T30-4]|uniref:RxLR effector protein n=1 Tax=Phytophthora infestans (strain T30-4) TaxID=403677 RepID=D0NZW3_PHYIT|nr:secreted RxLR effector peptide protein, putative [Phytophthora infestans T30-4]EEY69679.1 secreted RxLR effector peptide protein, putative [Phytophthora infestans T30-4]|eukprot:XP_002997091.1 secreted RxLR effector peptide protein, putative [Phytophthora infestans T30-4]
MRLQCIFVVMVAILAMSVNASFTASQGINSNVQMDQALTDSLSVVGTKRKLRAAKAIDGDDDNEERAGPSNILRSLPIC